MTKPSQRRSVLLWVGLGFVIGSFIGGLIGFFSYEAIIDSEQDQAMNEYLRELPGESTAAFAWHGRRLAAQLVRRRD